MTTSVRHVSHRWTRKSTSCQKHTIPPWLSTELLPPFPSASIRHIALCLFLFLMGSLHQEQGICFLVGRAFVQVQLPLQKSAATCGNLLRRKNVQFQNYVPPVWMTSNLDESSRVSVTFLPEDVTIMADPGECILNVAEKAGVEIVTSCGTGTCGTCEVGLVISMSEGEVRSQTIRACMAKVPTFKKSIIIDTDGSVSLY